MIAPRSNSLVSLAAALTLTLSQSACASASASGAARPAAGLPAAAATPSPTMRFSNTAGDYVHVYLVSPKRQWLLGRVEAGANSTLRIPTAALDENEGWMRVAVIVGQRVTPQAASDPRAALTSALPPEGMLTRRWVYSSKIGTGQIVEVSTAGPRAEALRR
jgi:hypothetical protein